MADFFKKATSGLRIVLMRAEDAVASPCTGVCALDARLLCMGCGRSMAEISAWPEMTDADKRRVMARLRQLMQGRNVT